MPEPPKGRGERPRAELTGVRNKNRQRGGAPGRYRVGTPRRTGELGRTFDIRTLQMKRPGTERPKSQYCGLSDQKEEGKKSPESPEKRWMVGQSQKSFADGREGGDYRRGDFDSWKNQGGGNAGDPLFRAEQSDGASQPSFKRDKNRGMLPRAGILLELSRRKQLEAKMFIRAKTGKISAVQGNKDVGRVEIGGGEGGGRIERLARTNEMGKGPTKRKVGKRVLKNKGGQHSAPRAWD